MTPLIQGRRMPPTMLRLNVNASTMDSPDPQTRHWASIRQTQKESQLLPVLQPLQFRTGFFDVFSAAISDDNLYQSFIKDLLENTDSSLKSESSNKLEHIDTSGVLFTGTLSAIIRFVLDYELIL